MAEPAGPTLDDPTLDAPHTNDVNITLYWFHPTVRTVWVNNASLAAADVETRG